MKLYVIEKKNSDGVGYNYSLYRKFLWFKLPFYENEISYSSGRGYSTFKCHYIYNSKESCIKSGEKYVNDNERIYKGFVLHRGNNDKWVCYKYFDTISGITNYYKIGGSFENCKEMIDKIVIKHQIKKENKTKKVVEIIK